jgi:hypothetical protein
MGLPKGRESQGDGVVIVVVGEKNGGMEKAVKLPHQGERESRSQGEAQQVVGWTTTMRYARCEEPDWNCPSKWLLASCLTSKESRAVLRGTVGKGLYVSVPRWPSTLPHVQFLGSGAVVTPPCYPARLEKGCMFQYLAGRLLYFMHGLEGGGWKSAHRGNSLAAYPTVHPVRRGVQ